MLQQGSYTPTNSELLEYWVSKRAPDTLLACQHAVVDYQLDGAKVSTNVLFEAATTANSVSSFFKEVFMQISKRQPNLVCDRIKASLFWTTANYEKNKTVQLAQLPNIFKDKKCQQFEALQESRFQQEAAEFKKAGGGGIFGGFSSFLQSAAQASRGG